MSDFQLEETKYGFRWGPLEVMRLVSDPKYGLAIAVMTDTDEYQIQCSPKGKKSKITSISRVTPPAEPGVIIK